MLEIYYWPNNRRDVYKYVKSCQVCQVNKSPNISTPGFMKNPRQVNFPFQILSADLLGPYVGSKKGHRYLLVVVDRFTKFVLVEPLANATSKSIIIFMQLQNPL